jgi:hypothetical protein
MRQQLVVCFFAWFYALLGACDADMMKICCMPKVRFFVSTRGFCTFVRVFTCCLPLLFTSVVYLCCLPLLFTSVVYLGCFGVCRKFVFCFRSWFLYFCNGSHRCYRLAS